MPRQRRPLDFAGSGAEETELIAFLSDPASYAEPAEAIERIETHAARVFLVGRKAYKVKKRVKLPFLDFSTLPSRRQALERELELNRAHAPEIYLGVAAISRAPDGRLAFGEDGIVVDYALVMNRFDQNEVLSRIAALGPLPTAVAKELADMVAHYHRAVPITGDISGADLMRDTVSGLAAGLTDAAPASAADIMRAFARASQAEVVLLGPLLERRGWAGHVRRCHGDLHLGNIVLHGGRAIPFDALEFDERLACIDVLYDLAFLLMDLDVRGDRAAANVVLNAYVNAEPTGEEITGLATLPLFLATRAAVRALVALESALQKPEGQDADDIGRARGYAIAASAYLAPSPPMLVAVGGLSGTGKSTLAARLAPHIGPAPGALVLRTDVERKKLFDVPETMHLTVDHYAEQASDEVYASLYAKTEQALAAGHAVIFDGVSAKLTERDRIEAIAATLGIKFAGLWLEAPLDTQIARVEARRGDASDSNEAVVRAQAERDLGEIRWSRIDAGKSPEHTMDQARHVLGLSET
jgi:aminoglycoside phosphotransferase family enzyme/predicted kinase